MKTVTIFADYSRRFPDPINKLDLETPMNIEHHVLLCPASLISMDIPKEPNPREQNIDRALYIDVKKSLLDEQDLTFHLKNKGITIIAHSVEYKEDKRTVEVTFKDGDGIVDGAHTYEIIKANHEDCPKTQYVKIEILTGISRDMIESIAEGLNTAVQVQPMSLANLGHRFDWIKTHLSDEPYANEIADKENMDGAFTMRDIVALMTMFNIGIPEFREKSQGGTRHPKEAYTSKAACLTIYLEKQKTYEKMKPILKDILKLYDYIQLEGRLLYNDKYGGKAGGLAFYGSRKRGKYKFVFLDKEDKFQIHDGALMPLLGAFRFLVTENNKGEFVWKTGSFDKVLEIWRRVGGDLINATKITSDSRGKNPNAIGKDEIHWDGLYKTVALDYLQHQV